MDYGWMSHAVFWFIGAVTVLSAIGAFAAMFAMGRSSYTTKD